MVIVMPRTSLISRALLLTLAIAAPLYALAHPKLVTAVPAANSHVMAVPAVIRLTFQERLEPAMSRITMVHAGVHAVTLGAVVADSADSKTLVAALKTPMGTGVYTVTWQAAGADGHPMRGSYTFTVDAPAPK